mmetsp:Transcript_13275/g.18799  ORF Transcript_13275/g.18799 Transcript_13275/m.18799 type:complete len:1272 (-) Transcript_13275:7-3822(-)
MKPADMQKDVASLNLSRYVDEVAKALLEAKMKVGDLPVVLALCLAMHQRYSDFLERLTPALWKAIQGKKTEVKTRRLYVRLVTEFLLNGLATEAKPLVKLIAEATGGKDGSYAVPDPHLVVSFVKAAGFEMLATMPRSVHAHMKLLRQEADRTLNNASSDAENQILISKELAEKSLKIVEKTDVALTERAIGPQASDNLKTHCLGAYKAFSTSLVATHQKSQKMEKRCAQDRLLSGSLSEAREKGLTDARKNLDTIQKSVEALSEALDQPIPELEEEEEEDVEKSGEGLELWTKEGGDEAGGFGPFDDEETRDFYCDIPDFLTTIPPKVLGLVDENIDVLKSRNMQKYGAGFDAVETDVDGDPNAEVTPASAGELDAAESLDDSTHPEEPETEEHTGEAEVEENSPHYALKTLLEDELPECCRREQVDEIAERFCVKYGASKNSRKRLSKTLFLVPRTRLDLLPYYSRLAAILDRVYPDVSASLLKSIQQQFYGQALNKKNQTLESRLKTARFIGELTKFRLAPPIVALRCLSRCISDFNATNIDVACCILESCGRYLHRTKHTEAALATRLEAMMRISKTKYLDERSSALIKSAFFMVKPPPVAPRRKAKVYPPLEAYLRYLLMVRLDPSSVPFVTKQLLRFPWSDPSKQCGALICRIMLKTCRRGRNSAIGAIAAVVANLRRSKPEVSTRIIDAVLEELQWAMEHPTFREQQRTLTYARLLGELYSASIVTSQIIIHQLFHFLNFGHEIPDALREVSEKRVADTATDSNNAEKKEGNSQAEELPVYNSAGTLTQTIHEDEEMEDEELETKEVPLEQPQELPVSIHSLFDPRVPSAIDPLTSVFRVKLVCTLLDASIPSIVTRNNLPKLDAFLTAFQRYLFTKTLLPSEVEFAVLDVFDLIDSRWKAVVAKKSSSNKPPLDSGFKRHRTWIDAHNSTIVHEEAEFQILSRAKTRLQSLVAEASSPDRDGVDEDDLESGLEMLDMDEEESVDALSMSAKDSVVEFSDSEIESDDGVARGSLSEDGSHSDGGSEDDTSDGSNDSDEGSDDENLSDEEEEESIDEEAYQQQLEEDLFERELRRVQKEALEKGKIVSRKQVSASMPSASQFTRKKSAPSAAAVPGPFGGKEGIKIQFLVKGNKGKVDSKEVTVGDDTELAKVALKQDDEAAREQELIKSRVLQYHADSAEQQNSGGNLYLEQEQLQVNRNRLTMDDIDQNFGTRGGDLRQGPPEKSRPPTSAEKSRPQLSFGGRGRGGRGGGRGRGGRSLFFKS